MKIRFLGAARTVTGSKYLISVNDKNILIDCGLFQGLKKLRERNWAELPINPKNIDVILITHAHIDHSGYLPKIVNSGYTGPIYATKATYDLCDLLLPDSGKIQEEDARRANKYGYSKHKPALPLYTEQDAKKALQQFDVVEFNHSYNILDNVSVTWHRAGHILGAAWIELKVDNKKIIFSGDIGRYEDAVMKPPEQLEYADYIITESTYGDRLHENIDVLDSLADVINETYSRDGVILISAFAVGRTQALLYFISKLKLENLIPDIPVFLDSPLAINATELLCKYSTEHKLSEDQCAITTNVAICTNTVADSKNINNIAGPKIIVSASGMMTGGRVLHHLKYYGTESKNTILITGYQAEATRGADLLNGRRSLKIHGEQVHIKAQIEYIPNMSAHADYKDLLAWLATVKQKPTKTFITHGEDSSAHYLERQVEEKLGWDCIVPDYLSEYEL